MKTTDDRLNERNSQSRIKLACLELENAIDKFENDPEADKRAQLEREKIAALKAHLAAIKEQIRALSI